MAGSRATTTRKKPARRRGRSLPRAADDGASGSRCRSIPHLEQHQLDVIGLALVAAAVFFGFVFYLDWDGGKVGYGMAEASAGCSAASPTSRRSSCSRSGRCS